MSNHEDRSPLLMKVALRQALRRLREEADALSQYEALAGNLGWEDVSEAVAAAKVALSEAVEKTADAVEAAVEVQAGASMEHAHDHTHAHSHSHPHEHLHTDERAE